MKVIDKRNIKISWLYILKLNGKNILHNKK